ncbi:hypothetical protein PSP6_160106 [Paraburkholderia tropica]|uniref:transcriptional regulator n=1 Tax=Paraburkholderia tropica TaxID=92647 RepID=UPI001CB06887|nr:YdaS family helix-turn-helix protein [Paraburkholderia tropica]CAG9195795.1 hypothetical protein PSP6_160106 [Paraburkholderia tropica]
MDLKTYLATAERGTATRLAAFLHVSPSYLSQMAHGTAPISEKRCVAIEKWTQGDVRRQDLRPVDWREIWPELDPDFVATKRLASSDDTQPPVGRPPLDCGESSK